MIISDKIYIDTDELGYRVSDLCEEFTYTNPELHQKKKLKLSTKNTPKHLFHYSISEKTAESNSRILQIPRGGLQRVIDFYKKSGIPIRIVDNTIVHDTIDVSLNKSTHLEEQQHSIINTLMRNDGGLIEASPGCITGDGKVVFKRHNKLTKMSLKRAFKKRDKLLHGPYPLYIRSYTYPTISYSKVNDIVYSGKKEVFKLLLSNGASVEATANHKIMTLHGWVPLECLCKNYDSIMYAKNNFNLPQYSKIESITKIGMKDTYDIVCEEPYRNFVVNNIVVHNSGKTIAVLGLISKVRQPTLVIVHEHRLSNQWMEEIENRLEGSFELGKYDGDVKKDGDIVVGIINSIYNKFKSDKSFFNKFGMVVVDECLDPSTIITTPTGFKTLADISIGDEVVTPTGTARVKNKSVTYKDAYSYTDKKGNYLIASKDHLMPTFEKRYSRDKSSSVVIKHIFECKNLLVSGKEIDNKYKSVEIKYVFYMGKRELIDIELDDDDRLFFANGFVSHNCHHLPAFTFLNVINNIPAKYRIGVTGTISRKDQKDILTYDLLGKRLLKIDAGDIKHRITSFRYKVVNSNIRFKLPMRYRWTGKKKENVLDMTQTLTNLVENNNRNDIIIDEVMKLIDAGHFPLLLSDRVGHNELLYDRLTTLGYSTVLLIGKTRKKVKWEEIRRDNSIQCIVANSKIASEGLDLPRLSALVLTCPSSNYQKLKQQIGRIRRVYDGKKTPIVVDICDNLAYIEGTDGYKRYILNYSAKRRIKFYNELIQEYNRTKL